MINHIINHFLKLYNYIDSTLDHEYLKDSTFSWFLPHGRSIQCLIWNVQRCPFNCVQKYIVCVLADLTKIQEKLKNYTKIWGWYTLFTCRFCFLDTDHVMTPRRFEPSSCSLKRQRARMKTSNFERKYSPWYRDMICTGNKIIKRKGSIGNCCSSMRLKLAKKEITQEISKKWCRTCTWHETIW